MLKNLNSVVRIDNMIQYSVIVPVYNVEQYLDRCIKSILNQTFTNFELILIDDGSNDNSGILCDLYKKQDDRIVAIHQNNEGVSAARNAGLDIARGKYIIFVDADDYLGERYIEHFNYSIEDLVITSYNMKNIKGEVLKRQFYHSNGCFSVEKMDDILKQFERGVFNYVWGKRFKNSIIQKNNLRFNKYLSIAEDTEFVTAYLRFAECVEVCNNRDYYYIKNEKGTSLSTQSITIKLLENFELANDEIFNNLTNIYGTKSNVQQSVINRCIAVYREIIFTIVNMESIDINLIKYIFKANWFSKVIDDKKTFKEENFKFRIIMKLKSVIIFKKYLEFRRKI